MKLRQRLRQGVEAHADSCSGGIQQINRLVRQLASGQIAARQAHGGLNGAVQHMHAVVLCITGLQSPQHQTGGVIIRLVNLNHLEAALQRGVALKILFVFAPRGRRDGAQFAPCQCRFQQVRRIRAASLVTRADNGMGFINKQQYRLRRFLCCINHVFQSLLKFTFNTRASL